MTDDSPHDRERREAPELTPAEAMPTPDQLPTTPDEELQREIQETDQNGETWVTEMRPQPELPSKADPNLVRESE